MVAWQSPEEAIDDGWRLLEAAAGDPGHPCRLMALATICVGRPAVRTLVLRRCESSTRQLHCYSDLRSAKVAQLNACADAELMVYHPQRRLQLRASAVSTIATEGSLCDDAWSGLDPRQRREYLDCASPEPAEESAARRNFCLLCFSVHTLDVLLLDAQGHRRVQGRYGESGWASRWLRP